MKLPLFSIIVPCYNTSLYLEKCLESIIQQTYKNWEIILVNDGSTDNTEDIIKLYSEKDSRIKVFSQKNQGLSVARNKGVTEAKGEYICFLDSDDWYKNESCLEHILKIIEGISPDIVVFQYQRITDEGYLYDEDENQQCFKQMKDPVYSGEQYLYYVLSHSSVYAWYPWRYAFKREVWIDNCFKFRLRLFEDIDIIYSVLLKAQKISILHEPVYQYRTVREGSLTQVSKKSMCDLICVSQNTIDSVNNMNIDIHLKKLLCNNFSCGYFSVLKEAYYLEKKDRKKVFVLLNKHREIMNYTDRKKYIFVRRLTNIFGLHFVSKLLFFRLKWLGR